MSETRLVVPIGQKSIILVYGDFEEDINVDELTSINYSNIFGEVVTISALLNRIGLLRADTQREFSNRKLECDIYESELSRKYRREANINGGKFSMPGEGDAVNLVKMTEDSLKNAILLDLAYQNKRKAAINAERNFNYMDSLYWAVQSKDKKLSGIIRPVTPEDFIKEIMEGSVNGILIKKPTDEWTSKQ